MKSKVWKLLYKSFDHELSEKEHRLLNQARKNSPELRREEKEILRQRRMLAASGPPKFGPHFADRILDRLREEEKPPVTNDVFYHAMRTVFRRVALAAAMLVLVMVSYNIIRTGNVSVAGALAMAQMDMESSIAMYSTFNME